MKSEEWICVECGAVTRWRGSSRWPATGDKTWPVTLPCRREGGHNTQHYRMGTEDAEALFAIAWD